MENFDLLAIKIERRWIKHKLMENQWCFDKINGNPALLSSQRHIGIMKMTVKVESVLFKGPIRYDPVRSMYDKDYDLKRIARVKRGLEVQLYRLWIQESKMKQRGMQTDKTLKCSCPCHQ